MHVSRVLPMALVACILVFAVSPVHAEVVQIRTGQVGGAPGTCPGNDDSFRYNPVNIPQCGTPFRAAPFTAADFAAAAAGPAARLVAPLTGTWLPALSADPLARWIDWTTQPGSCFGSSNSVLYARAFQVTTPCNPVGDVRICWAADDALGDIIWGGANPIGVYINGVPLNPGFSGGSYATETCFTQTGVPLNTGTNYLYVYQRDQGCSVAGIMLSASITVTSTLCPHLMVIKFNDLNGNGVQDPGENGLPGWQINVSGPSNQSTTTDATGSAFFNCVPPGSYTITETSQPGWVQTYPAGGAHHITIDCGQDYAVSFGNRMCETGNNCVPLPKCLSSWYPFDECAGTVANEVVANRDGLIMGGGSSPTWGAGHFGSACALLFPGLPGTQSVNVPNYPEHNFGTGSFTVAAWVKTQLNDNNVHTIVDKRSVPFGTPTGYALYLYGGIFRFQYGDGSGPYHTHVSTAPPLGDGQWHLVAVTACRNPANPGSNIVKLIVDNHVDTFTGASIVTGSLTNTAGLVIGDQCPGFIVGIPFAGAIDDVQLYKCCLSPDQIFALRTDIAYCNYTCTVPSILSTPFGSVTTTLTLCNYAPTPQTYTWTIAGLPAGPGCSVNGPTVFSPYSGTVTIPAGPSCVSIPITIQMPAGMTFGQTACYEVTTQNQRSGKCCITRGRVRKTLWHHVYADPAVAVLSPGTSTPVHFVAHNTGPAALDLPYQIADVASDGDPADQLVRLNGLPPGEPVLGTLQVAPNDSAIITVDASLLSFQPLNLHELVLSADLDGDGAPEELAAMSVESSTGEVTTDVPVIHPETQDAPPAALMTARPNPFRETAGVRLTLAKAQPNVRVAVFDVTGRLVRTLFVGPLTAGEHAFTWDGRDDEGRLSVNGIYFARAQWGMEKAEAKLIRLQ